MYGQDKNVKIMLIDDDESLRDLMRRLFESEGFQFVAAADGRSGLELLAKEKPDLLLLDVMMPDLDGYEVCRRLRVQGRKVPVFFLTAKGDMMDKRTGYAVGGDDYIVKPFNSEELLLRVDAVIRRRRDEISRSKVQQNDGTLVFGDLQIHLSSYKATLAGKPVDLTAKEFEVLALLASHPGEVFTRAQIFTHLWGTDVLPDESSITVFVHKIREKLGENPSNPRYLLTVWRVGYKFAER